MTFPWTKSVKITIEGEAKSGKTTILGIIRKALANHALATDAPGAEIAELKDRDPNFLPMGVTNTVCVLETKNVGDRRAQEVMDHAKALWFAGDRTGAIRYLQKEIDPELVDTDTEVRAYVV